jgi:hypothetical protein
MDSNHKGNDSEESQDAKWRPTRRTFLWLGAGTAAGALAAARLGFYSGVEWTNGEKTGEWSGLVLGEWEASVLAAAAMALIPDTPGKRSRPGPSGPEVAQNVDRFLVGMPKSMLLEIHGMFGLIEHATLLNGSVLRFTRLDPTAQRDFLLQLRDMGSKFGQAFKGVRDLCLVGWYQDNRTWEAIGYDGPLVRRPAPPPVVRVEDVTGKYKDMVAKPGQQPKGIL